MQTNRNEAAGWTWREPPSGSWARIRARMAAQDAAAAPGVWIMAACGALCAFLVAPLLILKPVASREMTETLVRESLAIQRANRTWVAVDDGDETSSVRFYVALPVENGPAISDE